jgi:predicted metal-dependent HD superfamily phosphohydrolase
VSATAERFAALGRRLGASGDTAPVAADLLRRWAGPGRAYHGLDHLRDCLARLDDAPDDGADRDLVEAALWFHDAVYDPRAGDNEARSAELARATLAALGVPDQQATAVADLVLATRHREPPRGAEARLLCDVDLAILGAPAEDFDHYDRAIRLEYAWVPEMVYRPERAAVLRALLARRPLYVTAHFRDRYEQSARGNLHRALARLSEPERTGDADHNPGRRP